MFHSLVCNLGHRSIMGHEDKSPVELGVPILGFKLKKCIGVMIFVEFTPSSIHTKGCELNIPSVSVVKVVDWVCVR